MLCTRYKFIALTLFSSNYELEALKISNTHEFKKSNIEIVKSRLYTITCILVTTREFLKKKKIMTKIFRLFIFNEICRVILENVIE